MREHDSYQFWPSQPHFFLPKSLEWFSFVLALAICIHVSQCLLSLDSSSPSPRSHLWLWLVLIYSSIRLNLMRRANRNQATHQVPKIHTKTMEQRSISCLFQWNTISIMNSYHFDLNSIHNFRTNKWKSKFSLDFFIQTCCSNKYTCCYLWECDWNVKAKCDRNNVLDDINKTWRFNSLNTMTIQWRIIPDEKAFKRFNLKSIANYF